MDDLERLMFDEASAQDLQTTDKQATSVFRLISFQLRRHDINTEVMQPGSMLNGSMIKVSKSFVCTGCTDQQASMDMTSMDIWDGASLQLLDQFCYLDDMLSVDGDADAAVEARVRKGWNNLDNLCLCLPIRTSHFLWEGN